MSETNEPANLDGQVDPYASTFLFDSWVTQSPVFITDQKEYVPMLAVKWEFTPDGTKWTFTLKDGVVFQDGTPFNATTFKANIDRIVDPNTKSALLAGSIGASVLKSTDIIDASTVTLTYSAPWVTLIDAMSGTPIWSPAAVTQYGEDFTNHLVGCGPFKLVQWAKGTSLKFAKDPNFKGDAPSQSHAGPAYLDSITVKFVGEDAVLGQVLKSNEVNMVYQLPFQAVADYKNNKDFTVSILYQGGSGNQFDLNTSHPPLDDLKVRQALRYSYDPEQLNQTLYDGLYLTMYGPLTKYTKDYWDGAEQVYSYDPNKANQLLDEAGWTKGSGGVRQKNGKSLSLVGVTISSSALLEYLQTKFQAIGVELKINLVPGPVQLQRAIDGDFDLMFEHLSGIDPNTLYLIWYSKNLKPGGWAWTRFQNDSLDEMLLKTTSTADPVARGNLFIEAQKIIVTNIPALPTVDTPVIFALSNKVSGFKPGGNVRSYFYINDMYIAK